MDPAMPRAKAIAVRDGIIVEVAPADRLAFCANAGATRIDCEGRTVLPGFIDAHCHIASYAESLVTLDLSRQGDVASVSDVQDRIYAFARNMPPGTWIRGKRYNEFHLAQKRHPNRGELDVVTPFHPVKLTHRSGHAHVLNSLALKRVGITAETGDPPGGLIDRDLVTGEPTGLLFGMAGYLSGRIPPVDGSDLERGLALASERLLSFGVTSVQDGSSHNGVRQWERFVEWDLRGIFKPRVTMMRGSDAFATMKDGRWRTDTSSDRVRIGGVKIVVDEVTGSMSPNQKELNVLVGAIHEAGQQVVIHAVEERTIEAACNAIEQTLRKATGTDHRHRIEHCSVCPPALLQRIHDLGITVVTQPPFIYFSGDRYLETVPEEQQGHLYPTGAMVRKGIAVAGSSDCPVADPDPLVGIYAAVTRRTEGGRELLPQEAVRPSEAIQMYTMAAASAACEETVKGSISSGKVADFVVLSDDPLTFDPERMREITPWMTILAGEIAWNSP
jgi:predicted amidohydrolase YtcJ